MEKEYSPEENLLRHIRQRKTGRPDPGGDAKGPDENGGVEPSREEAASRNWFRMINRLLAAVILALMIYGAAEILFVKEGRIPQTDDLGEESPAGPIVGDSQPGARAYDYYAEVIQGKDIFRPLVEEEEERPAVHEEPREDRRAAPLDPEALTRDLKLVGVVLDETSEAIIEDNKTRETHFLKEGEMINGVRVEKILEGRVILRTGGETIELTP